MILSKCRSSTKYTKYQKCVFLDKVSWGADVLLCVGRIFAPLCSYHITPSDVKNVTIIEQRIFAAVASKGNKSDRYDPSQWPKHSTSCTKLLFYTPSEAASFKFSFTVMIVRKIVWCAQFFLQEMENDSLLTWGVKTSSVGCTCKR